MFARTDRLMLRPGWMEDAPLLAETLGDKSIVRNLARAPWPYGQDDAAQFLSLTPPETLPNFLIFLRTAGEPQLIGGCGFGQIEGDGLENGAIELGYWIAPSHWGLGFATEAGHALIDIARRGLRLQRLYAGHFVDNPASGRVLRKLGFVPTGRITERHSCARGMAVPSVDYAIDLTAEVQANDDNYPTIRSRMAA
jgi:RimJ/RimL family protein N-acetyltransferase